MIFSNVELRSLLTSKINPPDISMTRTAGCSWLELVAVVMLSWLTFTQLFLLRPLDVKMERLYEVIFIRYKRGIFLRGTFLWHVLYSEVKSSVFLVDSTVQYFPSYCMLPKLNQIAWKPICNEKEYNTQVQNEAVYCTQLGQTWWTHPLGSFTRIGQLREIHLFVLQFRVVFL